MNELIEATPLISEDICVAFPIAIVIAFVVVTTLYVAWLQLEDGSNWRRLCRACGGKNSALNVLTASEDLAKFVRDDVQ